MAAWPGASRGTRRTNGVAGGGGAWISLKELLAKKSRKKFSAINDLLFPKANWEVISAASQLINSISYYTNFLT